VLGKCHNAAQVGGIGINMLGKHRKCSSPRTRAGAATSHGHSLPNAHSDRHRSGRTPFAISNGAHAARPGDHANATLRPWLDSGPGSSCKNESTRGALHPGGCPIRPGRDSRQSRGRRVFSRTYCCWMRTICSTHIRLTRRSEAPRSFPLQALRMRKLHGAEMPACGA